MAPCPLSGATWTRSVTSVAAGAADESVEGAASPPAAGAGAAQAAINWAPTTPKLVTATPCRNFRRVMLFRCMKFLLMYFFVYFFMWFYGLLLTSEQFPKCVI